MRTFPPIEPAGLEGVRGRSRCRRAPRTVRHSASRFTAGRRTRRTLIGPVAPTYIGRQPSYGSKGDHMPWDNNTGGGGRNNNGGGPWGQAPRRRRRPRRRGGTPSLEDILKPRPRPLPGRRSGRPLGHRRRRRRARRASGCSTRSTPSIRRKSASRRRSASRATSCSQPGLHFLWWPIQTRRARQHHRRTRPRSARSPTAPAAQRRRRDADLATRTSST